jgi:uncharacterized membrane protein YeiB
MQFYKFFLRNLLIFLGVVPGLFSQIYNFYGLFIAILVILVLLVISFPDKKRKRRR